MQNIIRVDPALLSATAQTIGKLASEYENEYNSIFLKVDSMNGAWQGNDSLAYITQIRSFGTSLKKLINKLNEYSDLLEKSSNYYLDAQNRIIAQAKKL